MQVLLRKPNLGSLRSLPLFVRTAVVLRQALPLSAVPCGITAAVRVSTIERYLVVVKASQTLSLSVSPWQPLIRKVPSGVSGQ